MNSFGAWMNDLDGGMNRERKKKITDNGAVAYNQIRKGIFSQFCDIWWK